MKRIILITFLSLLTGMGYAQLNTIIGVYGGAGLASSNNYNCGLSGGLDLLKSIGNRTAVGFNLFYQSYNFLYDNESSGSTNGTGNAGVTILNNSSYIFLTPKISQFFGKNSNVEAYVDFGAGFNMGGTETMRKWDRGFGAAPGNYDSTINTSKNINSLLFRIGFGLKEYLHMSKTWWFSVTEDFGFIPNSITKSSDATDPSRSYYSPNGKLNPSYFSLQIGFSHSKYVYH